MPNRRKANCPSVPSLTSRTATPDCNDCISSDQQPEMSFSSLVQDLSLRDSNGPAPRRPGPPPSQASTMDDRTSHISRAMSYASTAATSVSISGDISSQLHGGYFHPLARAWQAERQLTKVRKFLINWRVSSSVLTTLIASPCLSTLSSLLTAMTIWF